jgi:hypothetical protein
VPKRTSIKGLGADAFFTPDTTPPEAGQQDRRPADQPTSKTSKQQLIKATFYLTPDHVTALEEIQLKIRKESGARVDKSELIRRAIDLLVSQYTS